MILFVFHYEGQHLPSADKCFLNLVDGGWSNWGNWSLCTRVFNGIQMRTRECVNPKAQFGGIPCKGSTTFMRGCTNTSRCLQGMLPKSTLFEFQLFAKQPLKYWLTPSYSSACPFVIYRMFILPLSLFFFASFLQTNSAELSSILAFDTFDFFS